VPAAAARAACTGGVTPRARPHRLSPERCRQLLGPEAARFTDAQLAELSEAAWELASLVLELLTRKGRAD
jgi:hypothetical protein